MAAPMALTTAVYSVESARAPSLSCKGEGTVPADGCDDELGVGPGRRSPGEGSRRRCAGQPQSG
jgi:hypothetical protein